MIIREATAADAPALKVLYFEHLTKYPPKEEQDMARWGALIEKHARDENMHLLVAEVDGEVVATIQLAIIEGLTHNMRPFGVIESVVTHRDHEGRGYASALLARASEIAAARHCYKIMLATGSNRERTLNFYRKNGFEVDAKHCCIKKLP